MRNLVLTRIDDRLIHGQVVTSWLKLTGSNKVIIVDDKLCGDDFMKRVLRAAAPRDLELLVYSPKEAADYLQQDGDPSETILVLTKGPEAVLDMIHQGIALREVILGGMGMGPGRKRFNKNISATDAEVQTFRDISAAGVEIYYQMVPSDAKVNIQKLL